MKLWIAPAALLLLVAACSGGATSPSVDAGDSLPDLGAPDSGADAGVVADAAPVDSGPSYREAVLASSWAVLPNAPHVSQGKQDDLYFTSPLRGFAVSGPASSIYATDDGGQSWTTKKTHRGTYFRSVLFADEMHGFASNLGPIPNSGITDPTVLYQTGDGGETWAPVTAISGPMPTGICNQTRIDAQHLVAVGRVMGPSFLMRSSDGGASWSSLDLNAQLQMLIDVRFTSPTEGMVIGGTAANPMKCTILRTEDGMSFQTVFTSTLSDTLCWKISFPTPDVGYVSIQNAGNSGPSAFAKTTDGGRTWVQKPFLETPYAGIGIGFITEEIGWISSDDPQQPTYVTTDGGDHWQVEPNLASPINRFRFVDRQTAYAIGGSVYKMTIDWPAP
jgi:photosystem II stability/assembly factor-like uncharacterized protein